MLKNSLRYLEFKHLFRNFLFESLCYYFSKIILAIFTTIDLGANLIEFAIKAFIKPCITTDLPFIIDL